MLKSYTQPILLTIQNEHIVILLYQRGNTGIPAELKTGTVFVTKKYFSLCTYLVE